MTNDRKSALPPKTVKELPTASSTFKAIMKIDLVHIKEFIKFWKEDKADNSKIWQVLADQYINRPYLDIPRLADNFYNITHDGFTIYHRNHDVTHAVRQRLYAKKYLQLIDHFGNAKFAPLAQHISKNSELQFCLELAVFLCRSGRTNEKSGIEDPSNAKRSAEAFACITSYLGFNAALVKYMEFAIATHAPKWDQCTSLIKELPVEEEQKLNLAKLLKGIIDLSHHTDLVRCKDGLRQPVRPAIEKELNELLDQKRINVKETATNLLLLATQACKVTGTRVKFRLFSKHSEDNNPALKKLHTQDVAASMSRLQTLRLDAIDGLEEKTHQVDNDSKSLGSHSLKQPDMKHQNKLMVITKEIKNIIENFYLSSINIMPESSYPTNIISKKITGLARLFNPDKKISKSEKNKKVVEANELLKSLSEIENNTEVGDEKKIEMIENKIKELQNTYRTSDGNFFKALNYSSQYLSSLKSPEPMVTLDTQSEEFKTIKKQFIKDVNSYKKTSMRMEPSRIARSTSISKTIMQELFRAPPEFGGKNEEFVVIQKIEKLEEKSDLIKKYEMRRAEISEEKIKERSKYSV